MSTCKGCGAPIRWVSFLRSNAPLDAEPTEKGNIFYDDAHARWRVTSKQFQPPRGAALYTNHFATCPKAGQFKKGRS